ncbi:MAG: hypothetical protein OEW93_09780 [Candidatus Bathyarchaeota archaeon]|nr:hypothetical protein [Candidatus Bathyarchaeota archaeon]
MAEIYTREWYDSLQEILNRSEEVTAQAPQGVWNVLAEVIGDGVSPYVGDREVKRFAITFEDGRCTSYRELSEEPPKRGFQFVLRVAAGLFEGIVASLVDPVEAGLKGGIKISGDMRVLIQNAELVNVLAAIYQQGVETSWPKGQPPYS